MQTQKDRCWSAIYHAQELYQNGTQKRREWVREVEELYISTVNPLFALLS